MHAGKITEVMEGYIQREMRGEIGYSNTVM